MPDSVVVQSLREFRERMNGQEESTINELGNRWLQVERKLDANISALANEMKRRQVEGETITAAMVQKAQRYQELKAQLAEEIKKYNADAVNIISAGQERSIGLGVDSAQNAIYSSYPSPLSANFNQINVKAVENMIGFAGDGSPLSSLLKNDYGPAADGILQSLINSIALGQSAEQTAREMAEGMGMGLDRSLLIARTELNRAYRTASTEQYRQSGIVVKFKRLVARDEACLACIVLDGEEYDTADELEDHPNGRCTVVPVLEGLDAPTWDPAQEWFANQPESVQLEIMGAARFELYQSGMPLDAFATRRHDDVWGDSPQITPLSELRQDD